MLVAKFSHPLNCILEYVLINSWYVEKISSGLGVSNFTLKVINSFLCCKPIKHPPYRNAILSSEDGAKP